MCIRDNDGKHQCPEDVWFWSNEQKGQMTVVEDWMEYRKWWH